MTSTLMTNTREGLGNVRKYITAKPRWQLLLKQLRICVRTRFLKVTRVQI